MTYAEKIDILTHSQNSLAMGQAITITEGDLYKASSTYFLSRLFSFLGRKIRAIFAAKNRTAVIDQHFSFYI